MLSRMGQTTRWSENIFARLLRDETGHLFLVSLIILAVGSIILVPLLNYIGSGLVAGSVFEEKTGDLYAADAGAEDAIWQLMHNGEGIVAEVETAHGPFIVYGLPPYAIDHDENPATPAIQITEVNYSIQDVNQRSVDVNLMWLGSAYQIISNARDPDGNILVSITSFVSITQYGASDGSEFTFLGALTSLGGGIIISGSSPIIGDVFSSADLTLTGSASIDGDAYAETLISMAWSTSISGDAVTPGLIQSPNPNPDIGNPQPGGPNLDPVTLTEEQIVSATAAVLAETDFEPVDAGPVTHAGNWTFQPHWPPPSSVFTDPVHVSGNLTTNTATNITFQSSVHVDGDLTVNSSGRTIIFQGDVVVGGDLTLQNGTVIFESSVYVADGSDINLVGSATATFEGPVRAGRDLDLGSGGDVNFNSTIYAGRDLATSGSRTVYLGGDIYVGRNIDLRGSSKLVGGYTIVALGDVELTGTTKIDNINDLPFVLAPSGDFSVSGSGYASAWVYAPQASVSLSGSAKVYGALIALSASVSGSSTVEYPPGEPPPVFLPGGGGGGGDDEGGGAITGVKIETWNID